MPLWAITNFWDSLPMNPEIHLIGVSGMCVFVCVCMSSVMRWERQRREDQTRRNGWQLHAFQPINCHLSCCFNSLPRTRPHCYSYHFRKTSSSVYVKEPDDLQPHSKGQSSPNVYLISKWRGFGGRATEIDPNKALGIFPCYIHY